MCLETPTKCHSVTTLVEHSKSILKYTFPLGEETYGMYSKLSLAQQPTEIWILLKDLI